MAGDFKSAARSALAFLHQRFGFGLWMLTRTEGEDWIVLYAEDHGYGIQPGTVLRWADSFCSRMVQGLGPRIAPCSSQVPAYLSAPIGQQVPIQAYVGIPLQRADGALFGTLCAIDPQPQTDALLAEQGLLELLAVMLSSLLELELRNTEAIRHAERMQAQAFTDALTSLYNRRAWDEFLNAEEARCRTHGHPAALLVLDLNGLKRLNDSQGHAAGDALIQRSAQVLSQTARTQDVIARLGGDEFGVLCVECDRLGAQALLERLRSALHAAGISASIGMAAREPAKGLRAAWELADQRMYQVKHGHSTAT
jgi:diguanylate cyclase